MQLHNSGGKLNLRVRKVDSASSGQHKKDAMKAMKKEFDVKSSQMPVPWQALNVYTEAGRFVATCIFCRCSKGGIEVLCIRVEQGRRCN
jgi:hypothetical protein